jgi:rhodanese-related sulfurtransferase
MHDITVDELKHRLDKGENITIVDVREAHEYADYNIGATLIPLGTLSVQLDKLEGLEETEIVVHCRSGARSASAKELLKSQGYTKVRNLLGGMMEWQSKFG